MTSTGGGDVHDWGPLVGDLTARKERALEMGGEKFLERQRSLGKAQDVVAAREAVARALAHADAPVATTVRAAALVDGYRAAAAGRERPGRLRKPILGGLARLLAPAPPAGESAG